MNIPGVINPAYLTNMQQKNDAVNSAINEMQSKVNSCTDCSALTALKEQIEKTIMPELNEFKKQVEDYFKDQLAEVKAAIDKLAPLLVSPTDLGSVISWINNMIASVTAPYNNTINLQIQLLKKQAEMAIKIANLVSSINTLSASLMSKSSTLGCNL